MPSRRCFRLNIIHLFRSGFFSQMYRTQGNRDYKDNGIDKLKEKKFPKGFYHGNNDRLYCYGVSCHKKQIKRNEFRRIDAIQIRNCANGARSSQMISRPNVLFYNVILNYFFSRQSIVWNAQKVSTKNTKNSRKKMFAHENVVLLDNWFKIVRNAKKNWKKLEKFHF